MKIAGLLLVVFVVAVVLAFKFFPWWVVVGAIAVLIVIGWAFSGRILEALFKIPFRAKGAVLRGAIAAVHSLAAKQEAAEDPNRRLYLLDVTIRPAERSGGAFQLWEPGELRLVNPDAKPEDTDADGDLVEIQRIEVETEGKFVPDEGMKFGGPQKLRLTLAVAPEARQFRFRYYFELFGKVTI